MNESKKRELESNSPTQVTQQQPVVDQQAEEDESVHKILSTNPSSPMSDQGQEQGELCIPCTNRQS